jgi:hypothetical protein
MALKSKKSTYILIPMVIIVWGILFWKIFVGTGSNKTSIIRKKQLPVLSNIKDTVVVPPPKCNYPDPFLKPLGQSLKSSVPEKEEEDVNKVLNRVVRWPRIEFLGTVKSRKSHSPLGVMKIGNDEYLVREGNEQMNIKVFYISVDSIGLELQRDKRFFRRAGMKPRATIY